MWFLVGFFGVVILLPTVNFLLTALVFITTSRLQRKRETLLRIKEHLVFFGIVGAGLWTALHYDLHHLGNDIPSGVFASITIEAWVFRPKWAKLSEPRSEHPRLEL